MSECSHRDLKCSYKHMKCTTSAVCDIPVARDIDILFVKNLFFKIYVLDILIVRDIPIVPDIFVVRDLPSAHD